LEFNGSEYQEGQMMVYRRRASSRGSRAVTSSMLALGVALSGCQNGSSLGNPFDTLYSGADSCHQAHLDLAAQGDVFAKDLVNAADVQNFAAGTAGAAAAGYDLKSSLVEGLKFAVAAKVTTIYWDAVQQQAADRGAQLQRVSSDMQAENARLVQVQFAFNAVRQCRRGQADAIRADLRAGRSKREDAAAQMDLSKRRLQGEIEIAKKIDGNVKTRSAEFEFAAEQLSPQPYVTVQSTTVYAEADAGSATVSSLRKGGQVKGAAVNDKWVKVNLPHDKSGYVTTDSVTLKANEVAVNAAHPAKSGKAAKAPASGGDPLTDGVFSNAYNKTQFEDSVQTAQSDTATFELGGG
jgi:hypothetical protein